MTFSYKDLFGVEMPEAYQRLLLDCMAGDQTLFTRFDGIEISWRLLLPVLEAWQPVRGDRSSTPPAARASRRPTPSSRPTAASGTSRRV